MRGVHKYNFGISIAMMILDLINFLTINEPIVHALVFGYIYSCFWTYAADSMDQAIIDKRSQNITKTSGGDK